MLRVSKEKRKLKRRHQPAKAQPAPLPNQQKTGSRPRQWKKIVVYLIIIILTAIPFILGKYFEFNSPGPYDSPANVYSAKHILDGARIGIEEKSSAALGTLMANILGVSLFGFSEFGPKLVQGLLQAAALILMFYTMRKLFGTLAAAVSVIVTSIYISAPLIAKLGNDKHQFMIAFMVMGVSCFVLRQLDSGKKNDEEHLATGGSWWWALLAGMFLSWVPLFKETGISVLAAVGLFVIVQPFFKHRSIKQTASDIVLLVVGGVVAIAPLYIWVSTTGSRDYLPYSFVTEPIVSIFEGSQQAPETTQADADDSDNTAGATGLISKLLPGYVRDSWGTIKPGEKKEVVARIMRYYRLLILPIALAIAAAIARLIRMIMHRMGRLPSKARKDYDRFVLLFFVW